MKTNIMRCVSLVLTILLFTGMLPMEAMAAADRFTVSMHPSEKKVTVGDTVEIAVVIGHETVVKQYNSFDMTFSYDPKILELTSTTISGMSVTVRNGKIRVLRYGTDLNVDAVAFTLSFKALKNGTTTVKATGAKIGMKETAREEDAQKAKILNNADIVVSAKATASGDSSNPRTGDDTNLVRWNLVSITSLLALAVLVLGKKRKVGTV
jgi:hypothetical protein